MSTKFQIPGYSNLSPRKRQIVHMVGGGTAMLFVVLLVSGMIGGPDTPAPAPKEPPKPRPIAGAPGAQLDAKDAWMGGAGKELAQVKDLLKQREDEIQGLRNDLKTTREQVATELQVLRDRGVLTTPPAQSVGSTLPPLLAPRPADAAASGAPAGQGPSAAAPRDGQSVLPPPSGQSRATPKAANAPMTFPVQQPDRLPAPGAPNARAVASAAYPPGTPMVGSRAAVDNTLAESLPAPPAPALIRVTLAAAPAPAGAASAVGSGKAPRTVGNFLPVGFTRAVLMGGLAAPTGGQAQNNPVPVLLRLADLSVLPNGYRAQVKDCLVIGEGFGDHSAERAYIRATLLSCVMRDGQVLEVPIKGSVFGEDGMNGMMGKLITKQGAILGNALLSGIAAGIGQGVSQASQVTTTTALGTVSSGANDTSSILRQGFGTGVGRALDRLAQYYINLAERTFPVIEVLPGRVVDVVIQQGVTLDVALSALGPNGRQGAPSVGAARAVVGQPGTGRLVGADGDRRALMATVDPGMAAAFDDADEP